MFTDATSHNSSVNDAGDESLNDVIHALNNKQQIHSQDDEEHEDSDE